MDRAGVALVTGAARRVGRAVALRLAAGGYDVAFTYLRSAREADELSARLKAEGAQALAIRADLTRPREAVGRIGRQVERQFGRLDVLVNNASLYEPSDLRGTSLQVMRRLNAIHVEAPLLLCQRFEKLLRAGGGRVINMLDLMVQRPWPRYLGYCASKAGLWGLTLALARELAPEVTVNGIAPGVVQWPDDFPAAQRRKYLKRVPLGRAGTPRHVAELVHFLCSGGQYLTGQVLLLDGGRSLT